MSDLTPAFLLTVLLADAGCDYAHGFVIARRMAEADLDRMARAQNACSLYTLGLK
jgi:hypothetical protein